MRRKEPRGSQGALFGASLPSDRKGSVDVAQFQRDGAVLYHPVGLAVDQTALAERRVAVRAIKQIVGRAFSVGRHLLVWGDDVQHPVETNEIVVTEVVDAVVGATIEAFASDESPLLGA